MKNWQTHTLDDVCHVEYGTRVVKKRDGGTKFPVYGGGGETFAMDSFNREDRVVVGRFGMSPLCTRFVSGKFFLNDSGLTLSPKNGNLLPRFVDYWAFANNDAIYALGKGSAQKNLDVDNFRRLRLCFPPLSEQQRIVGILDEAFEAIATAKANTEKNLQNARALFESHLNAVFTELKLRHSGRRLSELCERITKGSSPKWQGMAYVDRPGVLFVTSENVHENRLVVDAPKYVEERFNEKEKRSILKFGDVLTNLVGASIGRTAVYELHDIANINQAVGLIRCHAEKIHNHYLMYFFNSPLMKDFFHANEVNNARANISLTFVSELEVPLPSVESQKRIIDCIHKYHQCCQRLESLYRQKLAAMDALKKSLLHQAFTGALTYKPEKVIAEAAV